MQVEDDEKFYGWRALDAGRTTECDRHNLRKCGRYQENNLSRNSVDALIWWICCCSRWKDFRLHIYCDFITIFRRILPASSRYPNDAHRSCRPLPIRLRLMVATSAAFRKCWICRTIGCQKEKNRRKMGRRWSKVFSLWRSMRQRRAELKNVNFILYVEWFTKKVFKPEYFVFDCILIEFFMCLIDFMIFLKIKWHYSDTVAKDDAHIGVT